MKLLKIVLIALVTVCIYSFTTTEELNTNTLNTAREINNYDGCLTLTFRPGITEEQKQMGRDWFLNLQIYGLHIGPLYNKTENDERYYYKIIDPTKIGATSSNDDDDFKPITLTIRYVGQGSQYVLIGAGPCSSNIDTFITN
jgi:hypothetical protein